jgi:hypothetical protein
VTFNGFGYIRFDHRGKNAPFGNASLIAEVIHGGGGVTFGTNLRKGSVEEFLPCPPPVV